MSNSKALLRSKINKSKDSNIKKIKKRIILKIGSSLLINNKKVNISWLDSLASNIKELSNEYEFIIVSSGAISLGCNKLNLIKSDLSIIEKQAIASIGQIYLMDKYCEIFSKYKLLIAQILLTYSDCNSVNRKQNFQNTLQELLSRNIIPIINENDAISFDEIKIGDNDTLSAYIANISSADNLILFSDVDGLYNKNPHLNSDASHIPIVNNISSEITKMASKSISKDGTGGMITKLQAAKIVEKSNCSTIITSGLMHNCLSDLFSKKIKYTIFNDKGEF